MVQFRPGDRVRLMSGGPLMSVNRFEPCDGEAEVECVWFDAHQGFHREQVKAATLTKTEGEDATLDGIHGFLER